MLILGTIAVFAVIGFAIRATARARRRFMLPAAEEVAA
jgi:hypothetical protein